MQVGPTISNDETFKKRLCNIVWTDKIDPDVFEREWLSVIDDFNL